MDLPSGEQWTTTAVVITGPSGDTIGGQTALCLATARPKHLILAGREYKKIEPILKQIKETNPSIAVTFIELDLSNSGSIRKAANSICELVDRIDVLINNAGIMALQDFTTSSDGVELQFATNHLGHFLFTNLLMSRFPNAGRIVNLSSNAYTLSPVLMGDPNCSNGKAYHPWLAYGSSKTANLLFTMSLASAAELRKRNIISVAVNPGLALGSHLQDHFGKDKFELGVKTYQDIHAGRQKPVPSMERPKSLEAGASAALDPIVIAHNGGFVESCQFKDEGMLEPYGRDKKAAERLWRVSEELVGQSFEI